MSTHTSINSPRIKGYKGLADRVLLRALCDQILLTRVWPTNCDLLLRACKFKKKEAAESARLGAHTHTHTCVAESVSSKLHRKVKGFEGLAAQLLRARAHTHTHTRCRIGQLKVVPQDQGLRGLGRPSAAASIHMCIAEKSG